MKAGSDAVYNMPLKWQAASKSFRGYVSLSRLRAMLAAVCFGEDREDKRDSAE